MSSLSRGDSCARAAPSRGSVAVPKVVSPLCELFFRVRRLLWTFWRRRQLLRGLSATAASAAIVCNAKTLKLRQNRWAPTATNAAAVLGVGLLWFFLITALVGAPGNSSANLAESEGQPEYYKRISGVGVGPSLYDRWMVRDIKLAITDWDGGDLAGEEGRFEAQHGGANDGTVTKRIRRGDRARSESGVADRGSSQAPSRSDVPVNRIATGPLVAENTTRTKTDLLITIFSGTTRMDLAKRELLRQIYDKYENWIRVGGPKTVAECKNPVERDFTLQVVFVVSKATSPPDGELIGDILYVPVPEGYHNIVFKTKAMLRLVRHFDFKYLLKADDDSYVCPMRIAALLHDLPPESQHKVYAGVPTACDVPTNPDYWNGRVMKDSKHRWYDGRFLHHTLGGLDCYPAYMQGAFYVLSQPLVEYLYRVHEHLECFTNEDVTIGSWLLGVDREMVEMHDLPTSHLWDCLCSRRDFMAPVHRSRLFFHNCKSTSQLKLCATRLLRPGIGC